jgi:phytoene dehydrogenase-like protein
VRPPVLNPAYPAVRRWIDHLNGPALQSFGAGVMVRTDNGLRIVADPLREPRLLPQTLLSGYLRPLELAALARWTGRVLIDPRAAMRQPDTTLAESLHAAGVTGQLRREVLDPFLAGVLADSHGGSSANFAKLLVRMFVVGRPGLPEHGMGALPAQLAKRLPPVCLGMSVVAVNAGGEREVSVVATGSTLRSRVVVVATDPISAARLVMLSEPLSKGW